MFLVWLMAVSLSAKDKMKYYLFVYFTSNENSGQQIYYALSDDGINYEPLNAGRPVISADTIAEMKAMRDPNLIRGNSGWYYMVAIDMDMSRGKWSNHGIVMMRSRDLIHWEHHTIDFKRRYQNTDFAKINAVWAPETLLDKKNGKTIVYFSLHSEKSGPFPKDVLYYVETNSVFSDFIGEPRCLFHYPYPTIDCNIIQGGDGFYHLFFNTWGDSTGLGIHQYIFTDINDFKTWTEIPGRMQPTQTPAEGVCVFPCNRGGWFMAYDCFKNGYYQFCKSTDLRSFHFLQNTLMTGNFRPRHGTVLPITRSEYRRIKIFFK